MRTIKEIHDSILNTFSTLSGFTVQDGTVLDDQTYALADALAEAYIEIENNKNPYLYSKISGSNLDDLGYMVNCSRQANEEDDSYLHRLVEWMISCESANYDSIENALMNLQFASYATYVPFVYGVGTAIVYIIPNSYDDDTIISAKLEVKNRVDKVKSAASYIEYVVPEQKHISLAIRIEYEDNADKSYVLTQLTKKIHDYINNIAIGSKLEIGELNKIGTNQVGVDYFVIVQMYINSEPANELSYLQTIHRKFVFDNLIY